MAPHCNNNCAMVAFCQNNSEASIQVNFNDSFQTLYELYKSTIYKFFYYKTNKDSSLADDLTQETFIKAYRNMDKIKAYCNIVGWLYVIANNIFIDYQRKNRRVPLYNQSLDIDSLNQEPVAEDSPCQILIRSFFKEEFHNLFKGLPHKYCTAIYLNEYQNLTYAEAADIMNISLAAYTSLLNRARIKLKEAVIAQLFDVDEKIITKDEYSSFSKWLENIHLADDISEPIERGMQTFFDVEANLYNQPFYHDYHGLIDDYILNKYPLSKDHIAADFGMGTGIFTAKLSTYVKNVDGYDFSNEMCELARKSFQDLKINNISCKHLDFTRTGEISGNYDYVYSLTVLHHLTYPQKAVEIMTKKLKKGGSLVISDFYKHKCSELVQQKSDLWYGFTKEQFKTFLSKAGLKNIWVEVHRDLARTFITKSGKVIQIPTIIGGGEK